MRSIFHSWPTGMQASELVQEVVTIPVKVHLQGTKLLHEVIVKALLCVLMGIALEIKSMNWGRQSENGEGYHWHHDEYSCLSWLYSWVLFATSLMDCCAVVQTTVRQRPSLPTSRGCNCQIAVFRLMLGFCALFSKEGQNSWEQWSVAFCRWMKSLFSQ